MDQFLNLDLSTDANRGLTLKSKNRMANSADPDEMAHTKPSHLNLHCLHSALVLVLVCLAETVKPLCLNTWVKYLKKKTEFRGRQHRTCWGKSHRNHNQNVVIK